MANADDYRGGWVSHTTTSGIEVLEYRRVVVRPGKRGSDLVEIDGDPATGRVALTAGESYAQFAETCRIQEERYRHDPEPVKRLLHLASYAEELPVLLGREWPQEVVRAEIGRTAAYIDATWDRLGGKG